MGNQWFQGTQKLPDFEMAEWRLNEIEALYMAFLIFPDSCFRFRDGSNGALLSDVDWLSKFPGV
jgi:hypothetical protein